MFKNTFYHGSIRKLVVAFGTLFNNIHVQHTDASGNVVDDEIVPISYESKQRYIAKQMKNKQRTVPRMGFVMSGISYDSSRKTNTMHQLVKKDATDPDGLRYKAMYTPMPYNVSFTLDIYSRGIDDGLQIIEQILPYFHPEFNVTIEEFPEMTIKRDIPIVLQGVDYQDEYEGELSEWRTNNWTLTFEAQAWIYPGLTDKEIFTKMGIAFTDEGFTTPVWDFTNNTATGSVILEGMKITDDGNGNPFTEHGSAEDGVINTGDWTPFQN